MASGSSSKNLGYALNMICERIQNLKGFAQVSGVGYLIEPRNYTVNEKINMVDECISEKDRSSKEELGWFYWRSILLRLEEGELIADIEERYPDLLEDKRIDISDVVHQAVNDEFGILAHDANNGDLFDKLPITMKENIQISIGAGEVKMYRVKKVSQIANLQDNYFEKYKVLEKIQLFDFSNIRKNEECKVLKTMYTWLKNNDDTGFCIKGYDVKQHLDFLSKEPVTEKLFKDSYILVYSKIHNIILHIDTNPDDIKKSMRDNRSNIRYLCSSNQRMDKILFVYIPVTLYDPSKYKIEEKTICKECIELELVVSIDKFKKVELFEEWWENLSNTVEDIKCELDEKDDISNDFFKNIMTFMAFDTFDLPSFTKKAENEIQEAQKLIMLTPEQRDIVYSGSKHKIIKGPFGSGKTIVAQKILKLVANETNDLIFYIFHDIDSGFVKEMQNLANNLNKINLKCYKRFDLVKDDKLLSSILQYLLQANQGKKIHVFIEEFNGEILNSTEIEKVKTLLENEEFKNSHIVIVAQSMESERCETNDEIQTILYETYKYEKLTEETDFEIFNLSFLMRSSMQINAIVDAAIPILEEAQMNSVIPKLGSKSNSTSTDSSIKGKLKVKSSASSKISEPLNITSDDSMSDTCKFLKRCSIMSDKYDLKKTIESNYTYVGDRKSAHNVKGKQPVVYYPFKNKRKSSHQMYYLSRVIKNVLSDKKKKKQVIICLNENSMNIVKDALEVNKIKWTDNPEFLSEEVCLLTDYTAVRGCEFLHVVLIYPTNEQYLKHNLIDSISRCILYLKVIVLNYDTPDDTLVSILAEWENQNLVIVDNQDYLLNVTNEELKKFEEDNHDLLKRRNQQSSMDINDPKVIKKLKSLSKPDQSEMSKTSEDNADGKTDDFEVWMSDDNEEDDNMPHLVFSSDDEEEEEEEEVIPNTQKIPSLVSDIDSDDEEFVGRGTKRKTKFAPGKKGKNRSKKD